MIPENAPWRSVQAAQISWGEDGTPFSDQFQDFYYNSEQGLQESEYVFLAGNQLPQRFSEHAGKVFCVAETGFGTGLNFLLTWQAWDAQPHPKPALHYVATEQHPLCRADFERAVSRWPALAAYSEQLLADYPGLVPGQHRLQFDQGRVRLDLWWHDTTAALEDMGQLAPGIVDAWYLDGFTPSRNESMWQPALFRALATLSRPDATMASFTAAGHVRRTLAQAGFTVRKRSGFGRKRECIVGSFGRSGLTQTTASEGLTPWDVPAHKPPTPSSVLVIGAGLAGATTAAALANRGVPVTVVEAGSVADGGSANAQGVLYTRLSTHHSNVVDFALQSFVFATQFYSELFAQRRLSAPADGELCGCFAQIKNQKALEALAVQLASVPELAQLLSAAEANRQLGVEQESAGYWYPRSGWLNPQAVCRALLDHPAIYLLENTGTVELVQTDQGWSALNADGRVASASTAVLATAAATAGFQPLHWLPLQAIRGQTTQLPATEKTQELKAVLCHAGYVAPARAGEHCIGASFGPGEQDARIRGSENGDNLSALAAAVPSWADELSDISAQTLTAKVRFRCASSDYLPTVGQVPDYAAFCDTYAPLRKDARATIHANGQYLPGLYLTAAHGSRGLTSTPLAAELLASTLCNEPPPVSRKLIRALSPARFIIRNLVRNKC